MLVMTPNQSDMIRRIPIICFVSYAEDSPLSGMEAREPIPCIPIHWR